MISAHLRYLWYVLRHKWFVFLECRKYGLTWQGIIHDLSKFSSAEWEPYALEYYGPWEKVPAEVEERCKAAWKHHYLNNPHHWEYWAMTEYGWEAGGPIPMPDRYRKEVVADWKGFYRTDPGTLSAQEYYQKNRGRMVLHPATRKWVEQELGVQVEEE